MSKRCEQKVSPGGGYGAPCNAHTDCQSKFCLPAPNFAGGYCAGDCRGDSNNCGPQGYCQWNAAEGDIVGVCHQSCSSAGGLCRTTPVDYICKPDTYGAQMGLLCMCNFPGTPCGTDSDCCSNFCSVATNTCM
ncbi:MAG: hypothetical protein JNK82_06855 [Myxococcaceae bacterium]|nr:hypothetical protein [Myxococcaceae bacterium]